MVGNMSLALVIGQCKLRLKRPPKPEAGAQFVAGCSFAISPSSCQPISQSKG